MGINFDLSLTPRPSIAQNSCFIESDSNINLYLKTKGEISFGEKFPLVPNLPDIKQIDFIKAVASMVGLFALPDGENGIKFIPFDNLSANKSKAVDWTNRVIMAYNSVTPRNLQYILITLLKTTGSGIKKMIMSWETMMEISRLMMPR